jgi:hypothetical protein
MNRRSFLKTTSTADGAAAAGSKLSTLAIGQSVQAGPTFRRPKIIIPVPTPSPKFQHVEDGVPDSQLTREATGLLREFSTPLLFNHSHRVFFWANEFGRQTGEKFDTELLFICAAFHDLGLLKKFSSAADRFEVDSANAVRQFLEHHGVPDTRIQTAWDAISLHTTPGIARYKQLEVELLFNGVGLDVLGIGYETFPEDLRKKVVAQFPRIDSACFDCHSNGHQNGTTHLAPDTRPQQFRHRIRTVSLRGVNTQRLFGSQRALKTIEDFTEFEQRTAYFDGDIVIATKKGPNPLPRGTSVDFMADFEEMLDFPPAPKLDIYGKLDPAKATQAEMRGQEIFFGKGQCANCHQPPFYTDNSMHNLQTERFFKPVMINNMMAIGDGLIKTFALRGTKDNPPYLHDERLLTLEDTVEFFNLILGTKLAAQEKQDLVAFLRTL